jgi:hypothetical protein
MLDEEKTDINMSRNKGHQGNFLLLYIPKGKYRKGQEASVFGIERAAGVFN